MERAVFALATPIGGAIAVVRITGDGVFPILSTIFSGHLEDRLMAHGVLLDGETPLDDCMAVYFKAPRSYTGEDMAELYIHGSAAVFNLVSALLTRLGIASAAPGEFTRRAFLNGKMDMTRAEAVMDLINAKSERSLRSALLQLRGALFNKISELENRLLDVLSELNAGIDFPEEFSFEDESDVSSEIISVAAEADKLISAGLGGKVLREGATVVIAGRANAGKSSLLNALLGRERAIVTDIAGTTRDVIEECVNFSGLLIRLFDTAGLRSESGLDAPERIGVERSRALIASADLLLITIDATEKENPIDTELLRDTALKNRIIVFTKSDLINRETFSRDGVADSEIAVVSSKTGIGLESLKSMTVNRLGFETDPEITVNARHTEALVRARTALTDAISARDDEMIATDIRSALIALAEITGRECDTQMLDRIFSRFCVGK
ncbi:MAG: tRNA uridine-5-carboxymethylaminomethyl(34) synthesis GTPase MnmE [Clostridia bacterium]